MRPSTLSDVAIRLQAEPLEKLIPEFLDEFYRERDDVARRAMFIAEPRPTGVARHDALLAAIAEYLTKQYKLGAVPRWCAAPMRTLEVPWHTTASREPAMIEYLTFASPAEFRHRNIFTEERPLRRASMARA